MTNLIKAFLLIALAAGAGTLTGCGQTETDVNGNDTTGGDGTDTGSDCASCGPAVQGDAGSAPSADAGAPAADAGSATPPADGGSAPAADAGSAPATDAGTAPADAGTTPSDAGTMPADAGAATPAPAPLRSPRTCSLQFADAYIGGSACGEIRGAIPGATWSSGPSIADTDADHFLEYGPSSVAPGTYELTYVAKTCGGSVGAWADYGSRAQLLAMTADARAFVNCNWWDAASGTTVSVASPGCNLRITVDGSCAITGAGNMRDYH